jgi:hypothetical protein
MDDRRQPERRSTVVPLENLLEDIAHGNSFARKAFGARNSTLAAGGIKQKECACARATK